MTIELHIEQLVLHGMRPAQREVIVTALRSELERLLVEHETPVASMSDRDVGGLDAGTFRVSASAAPAAIGDGAARALYRSLPW